MKQSIPKRLLPLYSIWIFIFFTELLLLCSGQQQQSSTCGLPIDLVISHQKERDTWKVRRKKKKPLVPKWIPSTSSSLWNENGNETRERHYAHLYPTVEKNCVFLLFSVPRLGHQSHRVSPRWNLRSVHGPLNSSGLMTMPNCTDLHSCPVGSRWTSLSSLHFQIKSNFGNI